MSERQYLQTDKESQQEPLPAYVPDGGPGMGALRHPILPPMQIVRPAPPRALPRAIVEPMPLKSASFPSNIRAAGIFQLWLNANPNRKRFVLFNPDTALAHLLFSYGNSGFGYPIGPGGAWDENGTGVCVGEIWVSSPTLGANFAGWEFTAY